MTLPIDFYFDFISPYGYLGATQVERIVERYGRAVRWRPFLVGHTVMKVMGLKPLMQTPLKSEYLAIDKPRMASLLGVPLMQPDMSAASSVSAGRAYYWIEDRDPVQAVEFAKALLHRLWIEGKPIWGADVVADIGESVGVGKEELLAALDAPETKARFQAEVQACVDRGVFGSPFFIVDEQPIWGVDRLWMLEHWLKHGHWNQAIN